MEKPKVLSGEEIVSKGITKLDTTLPELGLKDVTPNGSWLEQKQIQAALEARKNLIDVERIEKCGTLSYAVWHDHLKLAEVTHKVGGHWQYLGHNIGKTLYLRPEEALFLMEVNCLQLKHNEVTVSLQKAYSLLLHSSTLLIQYKVYASLSRLGYKVFRHKLPIAKDSLSRSELQDTTESENNDSPRGNTIKYASINLTTPNKENLEKDDTTFTNPTDESTDVDLLIKIDSGIASQESLKSKSSEAELKGNQANLNVSEGHIDSTQNKNTSDENEMLKEKKSPNVMDLEEVQAKVVDDSSQSEPIQEVLKIAETIQSAYISIEHDDMVGDKNINKNIEDKTDNLVMNDTNQEARDPGILMEEDDDKKQGIDEAMDSVELSVENVIANPNKESKSTKNAQNHNITTDEASVSDILNIESNPQCEGSKKLDDFITNTATTTNSTHNLGKRKTNSFIYNYMERLEKLTNRAIKTSNSKNIRECFENIPDLSKKQVVTVNVPEQQFIPKNIFVNKSNYMLNLQNIKKKNRSASTESIVYTSSDEVNGANIRRIRSSSGTEFPHNTNTFTHTRFPRHLYFRPYGHWRPQNNLSYYQFNMIFQRPTFTNMIFQRPTFTNMIFQSRVQYLPRPNPFLRSFPYPSNLNPNNPNIGNNARKRIRTGRTADLQSIKNLAVRMKQMVLSGNSAVHGLECLQALLHSYNMKYKSRLRLTEHFDIINEEKIIETIELDDDEESKNKKPRLDQDDSNKFDENLYRLRELASRLRDLESKDKATASHRRAFSKAVKTFNKSYNADVYLNDVTYEVIDRRHITLGSSSESDCVVEETPKVVKRKRLRNPFNILKRRSERLKSQNNPGTSKDGVTEPCNVELETSKLDDNKYNELITNTFSKAWLPNEDDFGRVEVVPKLLMNARLIDSNKEQYLYDFIKDQFQEYQSWLEAKIYFLRHLEESNIAFQQQQARIMTDLRISDEGLKPLIDPQDCSDMSAVLQKLRIIKNNNKEIATETSLSIDFDVYNRDVQNYKKTSPPKPHFRIICVEESSRFPSASDIVSLHLKYDDNVPLGFAIVGADSVAYLQLNPIDLPVYFPKYDIV